MALWWKPALTPGPYGRDFEAYYAAGATWNAGGDPYGRDVWRIERTIPGVDAGRDEVLPYVGPAAALPLWSLFARLPFPLARWLWELLLVGALGALLLAALDLAGERPSPRTAVLALALGATSGPVISAFALGQAALLGAAGTVVAFAALARQRYGPALVAAVVAAIQPNLALPLAVRVVDRRALTALAVAAAAFAAATLAVGGGPAGVALYAQRLRLHGDAERYITIQHTLPAIAASFGASHALADALGTAASMLAVAIIALVAVRLRSQPALGAAIAVALLPFVVPFFHEHDFTIELLPAIVLLRAGDPRVRTLAGVAAALTLVDWFGLAQRPPAEAQIACLAVAVGAATALLGCRAGTATSASRLAAWAPLGTVALVAAAALPLAHAFVAPTWPDTLGAYHAPPDADISTVWGDEQRRSGLEAPVAAWGLLRALPLCGCLLFAFAGLRQASAYAMKTVPPRTASGTLVSDWPSHGPSVQ